MKIAFTSCTDPIDDDKQRVWRSISTHSPDILLLLGDNVYMDYGFSFFSDHPLYCSRSWSEQRFADELYRRYLMQSEIENFRGLISSVDTIGAIWDDHDFAWNNSYGVGKGKNLVPTNKKKISKSLYLQFVGWLNESPTPTSYPEQSSMSDMLDVEDAGIERKIDIDYVRIILTDGRYYREEKKEDGSSWILGDAQKAWLDRLLSEWEGIKVICSGTTLSRGGEGWDHFRDLDWLSHRNLEKTVVLSGDIHRNAYKKHKYLGGVYEASASGAARPKIGGDSGNYGILDIQKEEVSSYLYDSEGNVDTRKVI